MKVPNAIIAIIPARANSRRVQSKNIRSFGGKPMIAWTIEAARKTKIFNRIVVTTDSEKIAKVAIKYGAEVPFLRSKKLSDSKTHVEKATLDCLIKSEKFYNEKYSLVVQLMPNSPLRNDRDIKYALGKFTRGSSSSQISCIIPNGLNPWWSFKIKNKKVVRLFPNSYNKRSQDLEKLYCPTGAIWITKRDSFVKKKTFMIKGFTACQIDWVNGIDIDTLEDLTLAKNLINLVK